MTRPSSCRTWPVLTRKRCKVWCGLSGLSMTTALVLVDLRLFFQAWLQLTSCMLVVGVWSMVDAVGAYQDVLNAAASSASASSASGPITDAQRLSGEWPRDFAAGVLDGKDLSELLADAALARGGGAVAGLAVLESSASADVAESASAAGGNGVTAASAIPGAGAGKPAVRDRAAVLSAALDEVVGALKEVVQVSIMSTCSHHLWCVGSADLVVCCTSRTGCCLCWRDSCSRCWRRPDRAD